MTTPIAAVAVVPTTQSTGTAATSQSSSQTLLDPQAFLQLLVAQLQYQDPSSPVDTSTFMNQTATLSQVQTMNSMSSSLESMMPLQQMQSGTAMLGKSVSYTDPTGATETGVVTGVSSLAGKVTVKVGAVDVALSTITEIHAG